MINNLYNNFGKKGGFSSNAIVPAESVNPEHPVHIKNGEQLPQSLSLPES